MSSELHFTRTLHSLCVDLLSGGGLWESLVERVSTFSDWEGSHMCMPHSKQRWMDAGVNTSQEAYRLQLKMFLALLHQQKDLPNLKQFLKLYTVRVHSSCVCYGLHSVARLAYAQDVIAGAYLKQSFSQHDHHCRHSVDRKFSALMS